MEDEQEQANNALWREIEALKAELSASSEKHTGSAGALTHHVQEIEGSYQEFKFEMKAALQKLKDELLDEMAQAPGRSEIEDVKATIRTMPSARDLANLTLKVDPMADRVKAMIDEQRLDN